MSKPLFSRDLSEFSNEELGKVTRAAFQGKDDGLALTTIAAQILVSETASLNGQQSIITFSGFSSPRFKTSDWVVRVERVDVRTKTRRFFARLGDFFNDIGRKRVPLSKLFDPNTKITKLVITSNDPFKKGHVDEEASVRAYE